jgi:hypothetical protein
MFGLVYQPLIQFFIAFSTYALEEADLIKDEDRWDLKNMAITVLAVKWIHTILA